MGVVTICAQLGSYGELLGRQLAQRLGYRYLDRETLKRELVKRNGNPIPKVADHELEERRPTLWERLDGEDRERYFVALRAIIAEYALQDDVVITSACAGFFLQEVGHVLRVQVVAPYEVRVRRLAEREGISAVAAAARVKWSDVERAGYVRHFFRADWLDAREYHLVVDTAKCSVPEAVDLVERTLGLVDFEPNLRTIQTLENLALAAKVEEYLALDPQFELWKVRATARYGDVALTGRIWTSQHGRRLEQTVRHIEGVRRVRVAVRPEAVSLWD